MLEHEVWPLKHFFRANDYVTDTFDDERVSLGRRDCQSHELDTAPYHMAHKYIALDGIANQ